MEKVSQIWFNIQGILFPFIPHSGKILFKTQQQLNRRGFEFSGQNM